MIPLFNFFFIHQLRAVGKIVSWGAIGSIVLCLFSYKLIPLSLMGLLVFFSASWQQTLMPGVFNSSWLSTLPLSRMQLSLVHVSLFVSGWLLIFGSIWSLGFGATFLYLFFDRRSREKIIDVDLNLGTSSGAGLFPELVNVFGGDVVLFATFITMSAAMLILLVALSPAERFTPGKVPPLSGNPWWHPVRKIMLLNWGALLGVPLLIMFLAPYGKQLLVAYINFFLATLWLTYSVGLYAAINGKIPQGGWRAWLFLLGIFQATMAVFAVSLSVVFSFLKV